MAGSLQPTDSVHVVEEEAPLELMDTDLLRPTDDDPIPDPLEHIDADLLQPTVPVVKKDGPSQPNDDVAKKDGPSQPIDDVPVVKKDGPSKPKDDGSVVKKDGPSKPIDDVPMAKQYGPSQQNDEGPVVKKEGPSKPIDDVPMVKKDDPSKQTDDVPAVPVPKGIHYFNPPIDSEIYIPGGICEKSLIFFELTLRENPKRFQIEFSMSEAKGEESLLHFRYEVSITEKKAIFYGRSPKDAKGQYFTHFTTDIFTPGKPFDVSCRFHLNSFEVMLNDLDPYNFGYTFLEFTRVRISGDVFIRSVHYLFPSSPSPPFCYSIPNGLEFGDYLTFHGICPPDAKIFKIGFLKKGSLRSSPEGLLVQMKVSFPRKDDGTQANGEVAVNHWLNGRLSQNPIERRTGEATIEPGRAFRLDMWMEKEEIVYGLDRREKLGNLRHRRLYEIGAVWIEGDISLNNFNVDRANNRILSRKDKTYDLNHNGFVKSFLKMPVIVDLREFFTSVTITGCVNDNVNKFEVELKSSSDDVVYLFTAIMDSNPYVIKQNDKKGGTWGPEETVKENFPFTTGVRFQMEICSAGKSGVIVAVDGIRTLSFHNRLDFFGVTSIEIRGDVRVYRIVAL